MQRVCVYLVSILHAKEIVKNKNVKFKSYLENS